MNRFGQTVLKASKCPHCGRMSVGECSCASPEKLPQLAERCEAATGPDIGANLALVHLEDEVKRAVWDLFHLPPRPFLHSLDAAMTLLNLWHEHPEWQITRRYCTGYHASIGTGPDTVGCVTPALALCAAALRASAAQGGEA